MTRSVYATTTEILATARISDDPEIMCIDQLSADVQAHIATARLHGYHPISVRWASGQFALIFCEPGTYWPGIKNIVTAYEHSLNITQVFPEGTQHE